MVALTSGIQWNYTTVLNIIFLVLATVLVIRFIRTGGVSMLRIMNRPEHAMDHQEMNQHGMHHEERSSSNDTRGSEKR